MISIAGSDNSFKVNQIKPSTLPLFPIDVAAVQLKWVISRSRLVCVALYFVTLHTKWQAPNKWTARATTICSAVCSVLTFSSQISSSYHKDTSASILHRCSCCTMPGCITDTLSFMRVCRKWHSKSAASIVVPWEIVYLGNSPNKAAGTVLQI